MNQNLKGSIFPRPKGPASLILEPMRDLIWITLNCFWNPKMIFKYLASDGISILTRDADIVMSPRGWTASLDLTEIVGGSGFQQFKFISDAGDYITAKTWDGTTLGATAVNIAKPYKIRTSITSESIAGVTHTYTYATDSYGRKKRTNSYSSVSEVEYITPDYLTNDLIYAASVTGFTLPGGATYIDVNTDGRAWAV